MERRLRNSRCRNKRGFVLTADAAISVAIVVLILLAASQFGSVDSFPEMEARRMASDIAAIMGYSGVLETYDKSAIEAGLNGMLPQNMNMSMSITKFSSAGRVSSLQINANITKDYVPGKWWYATDKGRFFYLVEYRVKFK